MNDNDNEFNDEEIAQGSSVFGDDASYSTGASVFGDDADTSYEPDSGESVFGGEPAPEQQSVFGDEPTPVDDAAALNDDPWAGQQSSPSNPVDTSGPQTIALDVESSEPDDLEAWSVLGGSTPNWGDEAPSAAEEAPAFDPGPVPVNDEPETVRIGDSSERFFTYEDGADDGGFDDGFVTEGGGGGDMQNRVITGVALLVIAVAALAVGPILAIALIVVIVALSAGEFYNALRVAGYQPATLLGLAASIAMPLAVYWRGQQSVALVMMLTIVFGLIWFLLGISTDTPVMNLGVTVLGVAYIGLLGSFGASLLNLGGENDGVGLLLAAIVVTIAYDVGAFFAGRAIGRTPLTSVSPNKTVEGLIGGAIATIVASVVLFGIIGIADPWDGQFFPALWLGLVGAVVAPLGDLAESLLKRDLGIKDMGSILPGHGGFLDRFDALLFVLPAVYYFALAVLY